MTVGPMMKGFVHGVASMCHLLGLLYNGWKNRWKTAAFHGAVLVIDSYCVYEHIKERKAFGNK